MSTAPALAAHPIVGFTAALAGALDRVLGHDPVFLSAEEKRQVLLDLARQRTRLEALELSVLAAADRDQVGADSGATSTAAWLAHETRADRPGVAGKVKLARALEQHPATGAALAAGAFSTAHAQVITTSLTDLPPDLQPEVLARAEKTLVVEAAHLTPRQLRTVGAHLLEVVAPEVAEARERGRLDRHDAAAFSTARLTLHPLGDGTTAGHFRVPDLHAHILKTALEALIAPRKTSKTRTIQTVKTGKPGRTGKPSVAPPEPDPVTGRLPDHATRMGQGLCHLLEHLPVHQYGDHGGLAATVIVTVDHQVLKTGLGAAALVDGTEISPGQARRLACNAGLIPAVLGGPSAVLDLGREARLFTRAQRIAMTIRDKGCRAENCDRPPSWTEAHHLRQPWSDGGKTDLADGVMLCGHHHHLAHHPHYDHEILPNGDLRFHRRE